MEKGLEHGAGYKIGNVQFEGERKTGFTLMEESQCRGKMSWPSLETWICSCIASELLSSLGRSEGKLFEHKPCSDTL